MKLVAILCVCSFICMFMYVGTCVWCIPKALCVANLKTYRIPIEKSLESKTDLAISILVSISTFQDKFIKSSKIQLQQFRYLIFFNATVENELQLLLKVVLLNYTNCTTISHRTKTSANKDRTISMKNEKRARRGEKNSPSSQGCKSYGPAVK